MSGWVIFLLGMFAGVALIMHSQEQEMQERRGKKASQCDSKEAKGRQSEQWDNDVTVANILREFESRNRPTPGETIRTSTRLFTDDEMEDVAEAMRRASKR